VGSAPCQHQGRDYLRGRTGHRYPQSSQHVLVSLIADGRSAQGRMILLIRPNNSTELNTLLTWLVSGGIDASIRGLLNRAVKDLVGLE
jgi:hypothetical protein